MFFIVFVFYAIIVLLELPPVAKSGDRKEIGVYLGFASVSLMIAVFLSFGVKIPTPSDFLMQAITKFFIK